MLMGGSTPPKDVQVRIPGRPTHKLQARTTRTRAGWARKVSGQDEQGRLMGRTSKAGQQAGRARKVSGQDGQGQFTGRMNVGLNGLDAKKLDANSSGLSPRLDAWMTNGTAQSEVILSGHFGL